MKLNRTTLNYFLLGVLTAITGANLYLSLIPARPQHETLVLVHKKGLFLPEQMKAQVQNQELAPPATNAQAVIALDANTKQVLLEKNPAAKVYPASTTKIITALTARDFYQLTDELLIEQNDLSDDNPLNLRVEERMTVDTLLKALLVESNNQAATILANHYPGGIVNFVANMNKKAAALDLQNTSFVNPQGYDQMGQKSTAFDLALAALELLRDDYLAEIVRQSQIAVTQNDGRSFTFNNTNQLLGRTDLGFTALGVKTGTTGLAQEVLISLLQKDDHEVLLVVLGAKNRYNETIRLANYLWQKYSWSPASIWHNNQNSI
ncbi:MAG: serine hydrolase [bacterium]|nr:serine hydrolase [bacterium]